ncbi:hypothetical protein BDV28DRAFT_127809 [Aspergillus coremiiformis]|uniref:Uncharacterized protein n=1 Tax=Aspergillus coremiiformis TaxID=138285 RepID=A0A5N6ZEE4_9EURO|nr:hypothetical protein BDV28DRAFT_127809 [Aspergillus coremiiformis]
MAAVTTSLSFGITASTTYEASPYALARKFYPGSPHPWSGCIVMRLGCGRWSIGGGIFRARR